MDVRVARYAGVCYGVERALRLAEQAAASGGPVHTLGPLIHNPQAVEALRAAGVETADTLDEVSEGTVVIRSHGVDPLVIEAAASKGLHVVDATCPHVSKAQRAARELREAGCTVVIVGEADHPEVEGIMAHAGGEAIIVERPADVERVPSSARVGVVVQTTQSQELLAAVVAALVPRVSELRVHNTICAATAKRQEAAAKLAGEVDVMIVVGGHNSGNTTRLAEISRAVNPRTHHVETADELEPAWFAGARTVGVTAGASTPDAQMQGVIRAIEAMG